MKIYVHLGSGHYIGSHAVVLANDEAEARKMIREILDESGLKNEPVEIIKIVETDKPCLISFSDGDY